MHRVNRCGFIDSKEWLDESLPECLDSPIMKNQFYLYLERIDPQRNMQRFYALSVEKTLFGETAVARRWGRIGSRGCVAFSHCESEAEALALFLAFLRRKISRDYRPPSPGAG